MGHLFIPTCIASVSFHSMWEGSKSTSHAQIRMRPVALYPV